MGITETKQKYYWKHNFYITVYYSMQYVFFILSYNNILILKSSRKRNQEKLFVVKMTLFLSHNLY